MFKPQFGIVCGYEHTILLDIDGDVWGTGSNVQKQISSTGPSDFHQVTKMKSFSEIKQVASTNYETFALTKEGKVEMIGDDKLDLRVADEIIYIACGDKHVACITSNLEVLIIGLTGQGQSTKNSKILSPVVGLCNIKSVSCGANHSVFLNTEGQLFSCGYNGYGQLGLGHEETVERVSLIPDMSDIDYMVSGSWFTIAFSIHGDVYSWGYNEDGQLGLGNWDNQNSPKLVEFKCPISAVSCGYYHSLFLDIEGNVWTCGRNRDGQLGYDNHEDRVNIPTKVHDLPEIVMLSHGGCHTFLLDVDGEIWCFGNNSQGQLGKGKKFDKSPKPVKLKSKDIIVHRPSFCFKAKSARK